MGNDFENHKEIQIKCMNKKKKSTDNIFNDRTDDSLHKLYNSFLINQYKYPKARYTNAIVNSNPKQNIKNIKYLKINQTNISSEKKKDINHSTIGEQRNNYSIFYNRTIKKEIHKKCKRNEYSKDNETNSQFELPKINNKNTRLEKLMKFRINDNNENKIIEQSYNQIKNYNILPYDFGKRAKKNNLQDFHISPVVERILKQNYLMNNPYSERVDNLGPSSLKNNIILYPISTYKFDFKRFIKDYRIHQFSK